LTVTFSIFQALATIKVYNSFYFRVPKRKIPFMDATIEITGLSRTFQTYRKREGLVASLRGFFDREYEYKVALQPTTLSIQRGSIVGLVGGNGAGKTTLLKLLAGLIHPTAGDARVLGFQPWQRDYAYLSKIGILLGQKNQLWWDIPAADSFDLLGRIYGIPSAVVKQRSVELAELLGATEQLHIQLRRLSLGERMKMEIIGALLHRPEILFLDEPTIGLDIVAQSAIREFLVTYAAQENPTIILTSHYMDDIAHLADRLLLISRGGIVYDGTVKSFTKAAEVKQCLTMRFEEPLSRDVSVVEENLVVSAGAMTAKVHLRGAQVSSFLKQVLDQTQLAELQIEQTDFEDVIHEFLAKESRRV
jgi:ABC-2 type transport system ATP-binding protein